MPRRFLLFCLMFASLTARADFGDRNMVRGAVRSDLPAGVGGPYQNLSLDYLYSPYGCDLSDDGFYGCPGLRWAPYRSNGTPSWFGLQEVAGCRGDLSPIGDSWVGCLRYSSDNFFSLNSPTDNYWVAVANSDPSFDQCNSGPPGSSAPIDNPMTPRNYYQPALYKVAMEPKGDGTYRLHLIVNASEHDFRCRVTGAYHYAANFLSVGQEKGRGQASAVAWMHRWYSWPQVQWVSSVYGRVPFSCRPGTEPACPQRGNQYLGGAWSGFYLTSAWGGHKRMLMIFFTGEGVMAYSDPPVAQRHWNWPIHESFYYPGSDLAYMNAAQVRTLCGLNVPDLPLTGASQPYAVDATRLFACASDLGLFSTPMPYEWVELTGFHWFAEQTGTEGAFWMSVESPQVN